MEIQFLADVREVIGAIVNRTRSSLLGGTRGLRLGEKSNYQRAIERFSLGCNRKSLPLTRGGFCRYATRW